MHLYYFSLCPFARRSRILLEESSVEFKIIEHHSWEKEEEFGDLNPGNHMPILIDSNDEVIVGHTNIPRYIMDKYGKSNFLGSDIMNKIEIARLTDWFEYVFYPNVTKILLHEKIIIFFANAEAPNSRKIRESIKIMRKYLEYLNKLLQDRDNIASDSFSFADITAIAHISICDYFGLIDWDNYGNLRSWYAVVKSRASIREILRERIVGFVPPTYYQQLDF